MKKVFVLLVILLLSLLIVPQVLAAPEVQIPSLYTVMERLAQAVGVGAVISFLFEKFSWFQRLSKDEKFWLIFGLSVGLPLLAQAALQFVPPEIWNVLEPWWQSLASGFLIWAGSQAVHKTFNRRTYRIVE